MAARLRGWNEARQAKNPKDAVQARRKWHRKMRLEYIPVVKMLGVGRDGVTIGCICHKNRGITFSSGTPEGESIPSGSTKNIYIN
jgi:hypothetical protein